MGRLNGNMPRPKPTRRPSEAFIQAKNDLLGVTPSRRGRAEKKWATGRGRDPGEIEQLRTKAFEFIKANPNCNRAQIAKHLGISGEEAAFPVRKLKESGEIKTKGLRAKTTYTVAK